MFKKVMVPVDPGETEFAGDAVVAAVAQARPAGGEVRLVAVTPIIGGYVTEFLPADFDDQLKMQIDVQLRNLLNRAGCDPAKASIDIRVGGVYHEVVDAACDWGADLIVVSSHRPSMSTYLFGSNAASIVRHAPCSVLVLRPVQIPQTLTAPIH